jgi:mono/diheme cytochrome c family protein
MRALVVDGAAAMLQLVSEASDSGVARARWRQVIAAFGLMLSLASSVLAADVSQIERGRYLTHDVAMCVQCHTPRDASGALIESEQFMGATFPVGPPGFISEAAWCLTTPRVAGLPGFTDAEAIEFFMTGARLGRHQPKWPMPPFRMSRPDAEAVVAYLRSLDRPTEEPRNR